MTRTTHSPAARATYRFLACATLILGLAFAPPVVRSQAAAPHEAGVRRALLIGINKYRAVPQLQGSINDIESMREILITRYGFEPGHVTMLADEAATRDAIMAAFERLIQETGPNDTVYLHYSGHGSQIAGLNGSRKADGLDETLVPQDGRSGDVRDILDDELAVVIARLRARAAIIVLDSCHSGTATRSIDIRARSVPQETRVDLYRKAMTATRAIVPSMSSRFVVLEATASDQEALDGPVDGHYSGFFTHALAKSLSNAPPNASLQDVFAGVTQELNRLQAQFGRTSMPEPQLEAPPALLAQPLFASLRAVAPTATAAQEPRLPWLAIQPLGPKDGTLVKGSLLGAAVGSKWAIYPPGETQFVPGAALAVATVVHVVGADATYQIDSSTRNVDPGSRAVAFLPAPAQGKIPVRILAMPAAQQQQVTQILSRDIVKVVGPNDAARFLVDMQGKDLRLLTADGLQVVGQFASGAARTPEDLARLLARSSNAAELLTLDNAAARVSVQAQVSDLPPTTTLGGALVGNTRAAEFRIKKPSDPRSPSNSLQLQIRASADSYITIVDVDSEGGINLLFPNEAQAAGFYPQGFVRAQQTLVVPDSLQPGNQAGFFWDYTPPSGTDTLRIFASTDAATANTIRERIRALQRANTSAAAGLATRAVSGELGNLRDSLSKVATRGVQVTKDTGPVPAALAATDPNGPAAPYSAAPALASAAPDWAATSLTIRLSD